jgi:predicted phosphodiesterase
MKQYFLVIAFFVAMISTNAQEVFITKPYVQIGKQASPTSMQVLWHVAEAEANWTVEYKITATDTWMNATNIRFNKVAVKGIEPHRVYHASLDNLVPGAKFLYRINKDDKQVFTTEAQAIKSKEQPYRFVVMGDIGAETIDQKKLAQRAYLEKPDFVAVPGDIVYENGLISEYNKKFWPVYNADKADSTGAPIMRSIPFIAAVGNHDAESRDMDKTPDALAYYLFFDQPLNGPKGEEGGAIIPVLKGSEANKKNFLDAAGETYPVMSNYSFDYGNAHWTVIDADTYVDWTDKQLIDWVATDLAISKEATWHFVMFHHPGFNSSIDHYEQQQMRLLAPIFEKGKVDVVFNGHVHNYQRTYPMTFTPAKKGTLMVGGKDGKTVRGRVVPGLWKLDKKFDGKTITKANGVIYVITGAGGQDLYNPEQEKDFDSWQKFTSNFISTVHSLTLVNIAGKKMELKQLDINGKQLDTFTLTK